MYYSYEGDLVCVDKLNMSFYLTIYMYLQFIVVSNNKHFTPGDKITKNLESKMFI